MQTSPAVVGFWSNVRSYVLAMIEIFVTPRPYENTATVVAKFHHSAQSAKFCLFPIGDDTHLVSGFPERWEIVLKIGATTQKVKVDEAAYRRLETGVRVGIRYHFGKKL